MAFQSLMDRVGAEFREMPGMQLTTRQVQRLCGVDPSLCQTVLDSMVAAGLLSVTADGRYARAAAGAADGGRPAAIVAVRHSIVAAS